MALRQSFAVAISPSCLPTLRQKLVGKVVLFIFRQHVHVLPELVCLRRATCLSYSLFLRCRICVWLLNWIQKETKLRVHFLACTVLQPNIPQCAIVLDLTSLAYQPKSCERSAHPKRHVTSALWEQKLAYPADTRELDEDEVDKLRVRPERIAISDNKDDKLWVQPTSRKEPVQEQRESAAARRVSCTVTKKKRTSSLPRYICHTGTKGVREVAWAIRGCLEFGQKGRSWSFPQHYQLVVWRA